MAHYDVFNGDADGICALTQMRNAQPVDSTLITGVKRDISLLKQVDAQADDVDQETDQFIRGAVRDRNLDPISAA